MGDMQKYLGALKPRTGHTQGLLLFYDRLGFPQLIAKNLLPTDQDSAQN
jgi:hypothetical protein